MEKKIIYIESDYVNYNDDFSLDEFEKLPNEEKLHVAKNNNMIVYSLEDFQFAFNNELISDLGYIFIV